MARGIIPARAGFTGDTFAIHQGRWDHPRSRGVYVLPYTMNSVGLGSSPLARGLRSPLPQNPLYSRIIPARAGFTRARPRWQVEDRDHPRSRGVYVPGGVVLANTSGSSPLARGLHCFAFTNTIKARIIPARAGFT